MCRTSFFSYYNRSLPLFGRPITESVYRTLGEQITPPHSRYSDPELTAAKDAGMAAKSAHVCGGGGGAGRSAGGWVDRADDDDDDDIPEMASKETHQRFPRIRDGMKS